MFESLRKALTIAIACGVLTARAHTADLSDTVHNLNRAVAQFAL